MVSLLYGTIWAGAIYSEKGPFDRHLRDIQTACPYLVSQTKGWEGIGPMLLGGEGTPKRVTSSRPQRA